MGIQGMELCAMAVVVLLFIAVLKQFGILEPISMEGNAWPTAPLPPAGAGVCGEGAARSGRARLAPPPGRPPGPGRLGLRLGGQRGLGPSSLGGNGAAGFKVGVSEVPGGTASRTPGRLGPAWSSAGSGRAAEGGVQGGGGWKTLGPAPGGQ